MEESKIRAKANHLSGRELRQGKVSSLKVPPASHENVNGNAAQVKHRQTENSSQN